MTTEVLSVPEEVVQLEEQLWIAIDALSDTGIKQGWVGLWWNSRHRCWLLGGCFPYERRDDALNWYDKQWKFPARLFYVHGQKAKLRCAKIAHPKTHYNCMPLLVTEPPNYYQGKCQ